MKGGKMKEFSEDEKTIARNIDKRYKWISRNSYGNIYVHQKKPVKSDTCWNEAFSRSGELFVFNHLFSAIKWEDNEPTLISDIYNPQILSDAEREYLKMVLRPFHDEVEYVEKLQPHTIEGRVYNEEYLTIKLHDEGLSLPSFDKGKMYVGMEIDKKYTLDELRITYKDGENK